MARPASRGGRRPARSRRPRRPCQDRPRVGVELTGEDRVAQATHQSLHEGQIVQRDEALGGQLARPDQVVEVAARVLAAGGAGAPGVDRLARGAVACLGEVEPPARGGVVHERRAVAREAGGRGAVERVDAGRHGVDDVVDVADPEQVPRPLLGKSGERPPDHLAHLLLLLAERAADGDPRGARLDHVGGRLRAQVLVHAALEDPVEELPLGGVLGVPADAAVEPAMGALHGAGGVVALDVEGRALVEGERDVRAERGLDLHRGLRAHEALYAVEVGTEADALLLDGDDHRLPALPPALDLLRDGAVPHGEDLIAAGVGHDRPAPAHELVETARLTRKKSTLAREQGGGPPARRPPTYCCRGAGYASVALPSTAGAPPFSRDAPAWICTRRGLRSSGFGIVTSRTPRSN